MRKCDSCLYGEKLYDGTLICQHIVSMQGREATQDYLICNRVAKCDFFLETNVRGLCAWFSGIKRCRSHCK